MSPERLVDGSPIFVNHLYKNGNTVIGNGQYVSEFQRANFWDAIHASGNLKYQTRLRLSSHRPVNITAAQIVPFKPLTDPYGPLPCGHIWTIDAISLDNYVQKTLIPQLHISPRSFPIFLASNVAGYIPGISPLLFTATGNHGAFIDRKGILQTYAEVDYDTSNIFSGDSDITGLSHEVAEWVDDPLGNSVPALTGSPTPSYIVPGAGCQNVLEVGDPMSGRVVSIGPMPNGVTYHLQELAFLGWFYNQVPSHSIRPDWYSSGGAFTADSATYSLLTCPPPG